MALALLLHLIQHLAYGYTPDATVSNEQDALVRCARFDMFIEPVNTFRTGATAPPSHRPPRPRAVFGDKASIRDSPTSASKTSTGKRSGK